jgi:predicted DNA repair protein MutK
MNNLTNEKKLVIEKPLQKEQIENLCNEVAEKICNNILKNFPESESNDLHEYMTKILSKEKIKISSLLKKKFIQS